MYSIVLIIFIMIENAIKNDFAIELTYINTFLCKCSSTYMSVL